MKKYIKYIILFLLLPTPCFSATGDVETVIGKTDTAISTILGKTGSGIATVYGKNYTDGDSVGSCTSCTTSTDSVIDSTTASGSLGTTNYLYAMPFTLAATKCITGGYVCISDQGVTKGATMQIWTDNEGSPGAIVGAGYTSTVSNLPNSVADTEFAFAATQTLSAGSYWEVFDGDDGVQYSYQAGNTKGWKYSTDGGATWSTGTTNRQAGVNGCDPT